MTRQCFAFAFVSCNLLIAQGTTPSPNPPVVIEPPMRVQPFPAELRAYLQLTDQQVESINRANAEYTAYYVRRTARIAQVEREIRELTNAEPLDPYGLGIRTAEVEAIRRDLREQEVKYRQRITALLTEQQRIRMRSLEEAQKLQPRINEAQCVNLMPGQTGAGIIRDVLPGSEPIIGGIIGLSYPCVPKMYPPIPVPQPPLAIRTQQTEP
jgi:Spy/CpxP family protein refolding chaperone